MEFFEGRPLAMYAQGRTMFLFLYSQNKLKDWYAAYCDTCTEDPSGIAAFKQVFCRTPPRTRRMRSVRTAHGPRRDQARHGLPRP